MIDWRPMTQRKRLDAIALLYFDTAPHVGLGVWRGRSRWSFNGWWHVGADLLVSLPIHRDPTYWAPFEAPASRSGGRPDAAPLTDPDASAVAPAGVSASSAAHRDMPFTGRGARGREGPRRSRASVGTRKPETVSP